MKNIQKILIIGFILSVVSGCMDENISPLKEVESITGDITSFSPDNINKKFGKSAKITGLVQVEWKGGKGMGNGNKPEEMLAFAEFEAFEGADNKEVKGTFVYQVLTADYIIHREITAQLLGVYIDKDLQKACFVGTVVSDTKGCTGDGHGGHDSGCEGGGCSGHDTGGHDGGCSGDDGTDHTDGGCTDSDHTDGGCSNPDHSDTDHTDGGCTDTDHTDGGCTDTDHTDGGCSGSDNTGGSSGDHGSGGDSGMGNELKGKNCRIGQIITIKGHDGGTPGISGDGITWKWFSSNGSFVPDIDNLAEWPHLCRKTIIGGNLVFHK